MEESADHRPDVTHVIGKGGVLVPLHRVGNKYALADDIREAYARIAAAEAGGITFSEATSDAIMAAMERAGTASVVVRGVVLEVDGRRVEVDTEGNIVDEALPILRALSGAAALEAARMLAAAAPETLILQDADGAECSRWRRDRSNSPRSQSPMTFTRPEPYVVPPADLAGFRAGRSGNRSGAATCAPACR